jgi:hypothetical protein
VVYQGAEALGVSADWVRREHILALLAQEEDILAEDHIPKVTRAGRMSPQPCRSRVWLWSRLRARACRQVDDVEALSSRVLELIRARLAAALVQVSRGTIFTTDQAL